ncbi:MAG: hypothetical protein MJZ52_06485 [Bacteroidales bacterium]|nr:hypothetical protein [Bacteroidales bacterium]
MKRNILVFALIAIFALTLSSCGKQEKTNTQKLCIEKGWVLQSVTAAPYYISAAGERVTNFYDDLMIESEKDDIIKFAENGSQTINPGKILPTDDEDGYLTEKATTWKFSADEKDLTFQIPFFYEYPMDGSVARTFDAAFETATITKLTETELVLTYTCNLIDVPTKETCTLTLTYIPVK